MSALEESQSRLEIYGKNLARIRVTSLNLVGRSLDHRQDPDVARVTICATNRELCNTNPG